MKSKEFWHLLINPFRRIAGWQAFGVGVLFVVVMGLVGTWADVAFDGGYALDRQFDLCTIVSLFRY